MNQEQETLVSRLDEAGLSLRRFISVGDDKAPREPNEWQNNLHTPDELNGSPAWGVVGREGLVLIDTDDEETAKFVGEHLPHTFVSVSPRRKLPHFYFNVKAGEVPNRVLKLPGETKGGGEIRAQNQYLVAPGSVVKWGKYEILKDRPIATLDYHTFMRKIEPLLGSDTTQPITRELMQDGVPQGTRHHYGIRYATRLIGMEGLDTAAAIDVLERWNQKNTPPMNEGDLERMVKNAVGYIKPEPPEENDPYDIPKDAEITDQMISDAILAEHDFYCDEDDINTDFYVWKDGLWRIDPAKNIILKKLSNIFDGRKSRSKLMVDKTTGFIQGLAMKNPLPPAPLNLICFKNGLLDINTMELKPHDKGHFIVNQIPHEYDPDAECPRWLDWINDTMKEEDIDFFQEWVGYMMYRSIPEASFLVATGQGQNGKTVAFDVLINLIGEKNNTTISLPGLSYELFSRAELYHKLTNISDDLGNTKIKNAGELKKASSGSSLNAQRKYGQPFDFKPYAKIMYACNEPPEIRDQSDAIKLRLQVVEFPHQFVKRPNSDQKQARDRDEIMDELLAELQGIINWAVKGLRRFIKNHSSFSSAKSRDETWKFYLRKSKPVLSFYKECMNITDNQNDRISPNALYIMLCDWLDHHKIKLEVSKKKMMKDLREEEDLKPDRLRKDNQESFYYGVLCDCASSFSTSVEKKEDNRGEVATRVSQHNARAHTLDDYDERDPSDDEGYSSPR